jgi:hypothetical protein
MRIMTREETEKKLPGVPFLKNGLSGRKGESFAKSILTNLVVFL